MKEQPILFNGDMVRAILDGRKTQTRRIIKPQPEWVERKQNSLSAAGWSWEGKNPYLKLDHWPNAQEFAQNMVKACPFGQPGDRLWVRETWHDEKTGYYLYKADLPYRFNAEDTEIGEEITIEACDFKWRPSIHMPREASRITLEIDEIRVERLQHITDEDALAEGFKGYGSCCGCGSCFGTDCRIPPIEEFEETWNSIYGNFKDNPWVWVIKFHRLEAVADV